MNKELIPIHLMPIPKIILDNPALKVRWQLSVDSSGGKTLAKGIIDSLGQKGLISKEEWSAIIQDIDTNYTDMSEQTKLYARKDIPLRIHKETFREYETEEGKFISESVMSQLSTASRDMNDAILKSQRHDAHLWELGQMVEPLRSAVGKLGIDETVFQMDNILKRLSRIASYSPEALLTIELVMRIKKSVLGGRISEATTTLCCLFQHFNDERAKEAKKREIFHKSWVGVNEQLSKNIGYLIRSATKEERERFEKSAEEVLKKCSYCVEV